MASDSVRPRTLQKALIKLCLIENIVNDASLKSHLLQTTDAKLSFKSMICGTFWLPSACVYEQWGAFLVAQMVKKLPAMWQTQKKKTTSQYLKNIGNSK